MENEYYLWLDESGNFQEIENCNKETPSLVGGLLCTKNLYQTIDPKKIRIDTKSNPLYHDAIDEYIKTNGKKCDFRHAMELPKSIRAQARTEILERIYKTGCEFVIFQNEYKLSIIDTNTTYLNILAEGIVQLLIDLSIVGNININIIIGKRLDTEKSYNTGKINNIFYINEYEYVRHIKERLIVAMAKLNLNKNKINYRIQMDSDKSNDYLVLSDYICCMYFGKNYSIYDEAYHKNSNISCGNIIRNIFDEKTRIYSIYENGTKIKIRKYISEGNYGVGFPSIFSEDIDEKYLNLIRDGFNNLTDKAKDWQFQAFYTTIHSIIGEMAAYNLALKILKGVAEFVDILKLNKTQCNEYKINIYLFIVTVYTHMGEQLNAKKYLDKCSILLPGILSKHENFDLYFIYVNRKIVNYQDLCDFESSIQCGEESLAVADLLIENMNKIKNLLYLESNTYYVQKAKLCGSLARTYYYWSATNKDMIQKARIMSDLSISNFMLDEDKKRQYFLRAEIELRANNRELAIEYLAKGLGCAPNSIVQFCVENDCSLFSWMTILKFCLSILNGDVNDDQYKYYEKLYTIIDQKSKQLLGGTIYPTHMLAITLGRIYIQKKNIKKAKECFTVAVKLGATDENKYNVSWLIGTSARANYILALMLNDENDEANKQKKELIYDLKEASSELDYRPVKSLYEKWHHLAIESNYSDLLEELFY
ncbi:hypothetical protein [Sedimentibacter sp. B4]|uniref:hypothetical protein n=1 Tax=Sedimentibacter sp. B4 TaxID=304766 RepID=UPI0002FB2AD5|nr:hypothetical protein [Sedimentibacter sp. B4]